MDAHHRSGYRSGNLPTEELSEDLVEVRDFDGDDGLSGCFEGGYTGVLARVGGACVANVNEEAVVAVDRGRGQGFAVHRGDALAQLAG